MKMSRIVPMLPVRSMPASVAWYRRLGFTVAQQEPAWRWALLDFDGCQLMLDESIRLHDGIPQQTVIYLYPDDIQAFHRQARANGLSLPDLETTFYGMTECRLDDPDGNRLWIGQDRAAGGSA